MKHTIKVGEFRYPYDQPHAARDPVGAIIESSPEYEWEIVHAPMRNGPETIDDIHPAIHRRINKAYKSFKKGLKLRQPPKHSRGLPAKIGHNLTHSEIEHNLKHGAIEQAIRRMRKGRLKDTLQWDLRSHPDGLLYSNAWTTRGLDD